MATKNVSKKGGKGTTKNREAGDEKTAAPASGSSGERVGRKRFARSPIIVTGGIRGCSVAVTSGFLVDPHNPGVNRFRELEHDNRELQIRSIEIDGPGASIIIEGNITTIFPREGSVRVEFDYTDEE